jgi:hypothetical protein
LPCEPEARAGELTKKHGGLLFTKTEIEEFKHIAEQCGETLWRFEEFKAIEV